MRIFWIFIIGSVFGFFAEMIYALVYTRALEIRQGLLYGPFIQIYGNDNYIELDEKKLELLYNGVKLKNNKASGLYRIYDGQKNFIGIAKLENGYLKREIWL